VDSILKKDKNQIKLSIEDNGCGFDPEEKLKESKIVSGFGLASMRDRTSLIHGKFEIVSEKGEGTKIHISLPFDSPSSET
jgi:two-component system sensor histidine kinase DegS